MTRLRSISGRPVSVFDQHANGHPRYHRKESDCSITDGSIVEKSLVSTSCNFKGPIEGVKEEYKKYTYRCQQELYDMKKSISEPFQEMCFSQEDIMESVVGLFRNDQQMSYGEHVSEIRQKARALGKVVANGPKLKRPGKLPPLTKAKAEKVQTQKKNSKTSLQSPTSDSGAKTEDSAAAGLVKARWINNYHKYKKTQEMDNKKTATSGNKRLLVGKYGEGSGKKKDEMRSPESEDRCAAEAEKQSGDDRTKPASLNMVPELGQ